MTKQDLLKTIAETAYNVGFGAKKHFATFDIVSKVPGIIGFASVSVGVFALFLEFLSTRLLSAAFIVLGIAGMCIAHYDEKKQSYAQSGKELTGLFNRLKGLYFRVKAHEDDDVSRFEGELSEIEREASSLGISEQIMFSDWYAHYKFFWQHQIDWIEEELKFRLFRDKIPLSVWIWLIGIVLVGVFARCGCLDLNQEHQERMEKNIEHQCSADR